MGHEIMFKEPYELTTLIKCFERLVSAFIQLIESA